MRVNTFRLPTGSQQKISSIRIRFPTQSLESPCDPGLYFVFRPCNRIATQLNGLRKLALGHPAIDRRTAKPDTVLNLGQANEPRHPPRPKRTTMQPERPSIWSHDSNETASGKPGTLQFARCRSIQACGASARSCCVPERKLVLGINHQEKGAPSPTCPPG